MRPNRAPLDRGAALLGLLVVVAANARYLAGLTSVVDPVVSLEPFYIELAGKSLARIFAQPDWGPLYALWLKPLRWWLGDPLLVYAYDIVALSVALSLAVYLYVLLLTRRAAVAVAAALFFLVSNLNVPLPSPVCGFALLVLVAGLALSELVDGGAERAAVAALAALTAGYVRPEIYPAAPLLWLWSVVLAARTRRSGWARFAPPAFAGLILLASAVVLGAPISGDDGRLLSAFREHYAWNWAVWHGGGIGYADVWKKVFGDAQSLPAALRANPDAFLRHVAANTVAVVRFMVLSCFDHVPLLAPRSMPLFDAGENLLVATAALVCLLVVAARGEWRRRALERYGHVVVPFLLLSFFPLVAACIVFPKTHYLVVPAALLVMSALLAATVIVPRTRDLARRQRLIAALLCVAVVPSPYAVTGVPFSPRGVHIERPVTEAVELIRSQGLPPPVHVLTFTDGLASLLGTGFVEVKIWQRGEQSLESYLRSEHIDVIVTMERGRKSFFLDDPLWDRIQLEPDKTDFAPLQAAESDPVRIWVRRALLSLPCFDAASAPPG